MTQQIPALPLTEGDIKEWANMGYWKSEEAIKLSMGLCPNKPNRGVEQQEAERIGDEFVRRMHILARSFSAESPNKRCPFEYRLNPDGDEHSDKDIVHDAVKFTKWARSSFASFPDNLYLAVINNVMPSKHNIDKSNTESKGNPGSDAKWAVKREIVKKAEEYVEKSLKKGCKECNHSQLAEFMFRYATDDQKNILFDYPGEKESTLKKYLLEGAKNALIDQPHRIAGTKGSYKSEGECELHPVKQ